MKKPKMTINEVLSEMRDSGFKISQKTFYEGVDNGIFPFVHILSVGEAGRRSVLILRKEYESWANEFLAI